MFKYLFSFLRGEPKVNRAKFEIEYYPLSKKYYCKVNGRYLKTDYHTGIIRTTDWDDLVFAEQFSEENYAKQLIEKYKEQHFKENIITTEIK